MNDSPAKLQTGLTIALCAAAIGGAGTQIIDNVRQGAHLESTAEQRAQNIAARNREIDYLHARVAALESRNCP